MNEVKLLTLLELRSLYAINKFLHTSDKKYKKRYLTLSATWAFLILLLFFYVSSLTYGLCTLGLSGIVPAYLSTIAALLIFAFGIFKAGSTVFSPRGYDLLTAMPIRASSVVLSRFLFLYIEDLLFSLLIFLPGTVTYGVCTRPNVFFYPLMLLGVLLVPAVPLVLSTVVGTLITAISTHMKHKSLIQTILMVAFLVLVLTGSFLMGDTAESLTSDQLTNLAATVGDTITGLYPPAAWLSNTVLHHSLPDALLFLAVSVLPTVGIFLLVSGNYHRITRRLLTTAASHSYTMETLSTRSHLKSLYLREVKRYFSSGIYVTNTIIGPIMGAILAVFIFIMGPDTITSTIPFDGLPLLPYAFAAIFSMMPTTTVSISMEGKQFWLLQTLPIPTNTLFDAKILLNLSLILPFYLLSELLLILALHPTLPDLLWILLIPAAVTLFSVVCGLTINLKLHSFDWEKEESIVKQSASAGIGGFIGFFLSLLLGAVMFLLPTQYTIPVQSLFCILILLGTLLLYHKNNTTQLHTL